MAKWDGEILLIKTVSNGNNENGFLLNPTEQSRSIFCNVLSVGQGEFYKAAQVGITIKAQVEVRTVDYEGETLAELECKRYEIKRTFSPDNGDLTELYLSDLRQGGGGDGTI